MDSMKQGYGMTELTILVTFSDLDVPSSSVGKVMPSMKMKVSKVVLFFLNFHSSEARSPSFGVITSDLYTPRIRLTK